MKLEEEILALKPDGEEMQKEIDEIIKVEDLINRFQGNDREELKEKKKKMVDDFVQQYNVSQKTMNELIFDRSAYLRAKETREEVNKKAWTDHVGLDWTNDINKAEINCNDASNRYKYTLEKSSLESMVSSINPEQVTPDFLYYLKDYKCDNKIYNNALNKFAVSIKPEQINKDVLEFLYENKYTPKEEGSILDFSYKMYCDGKEKDNEIKELEESNKQKDSTIDEQKDMIHVLNERANSLEIALNNIKDKAKGFANRISENMSKIGILQKEVAEKEQKGLFAIIGDKIKNIFKKDKPLLLSESIYNVQTDMNKVYGEINQEISKPSTIKSKEEAFMDLRARKQRDKIAIFNKDYENVK